MEDLFETFCLGPQLARRGEISTNSEGILAHDAASPSALGTREGVAEPVDAVFGEVFIDGLGGARGEAEFGTGLGETGVCVLPEHVIEDEGAGGLFAGRDGVEVVGVLVGGGLEGEGGVGARVRHGVGVDGGVGGGGGDEEEGLGVAREIRPGDGR